MITAPQLHKTLPDYLSIRRFVSGIGATKHTNGLSNDPARGSFGVQRLAATSLGNLAPNTNHSLIILVLDRASALLQTTKKSLGWFTTEAHNTGDVLLSRNLEMHYHWGFGVSLPCSEWERVGPPR